MRQRARKNRKKAQKAKKKRQQRLRQRSNFAFPNDRRKRQAYGPIPEESNEDFTVKNNINFLTYLCVTVFCVGSVSAI